MRVRVALVFARARARALPVFLDENAEGSAVADRLLDLEADAIGRGPLLRFRQGELYVDRATFEAREERGAGRDGIRELGARAERDALFDTPVRREVRDFALRETEAKGIAAKSELHLGCHGSIAPQMMPHVRWGLATVLLVACRSSAPAPAPAPSVNTAPPVAASAAKLPLVRVADAKLPGGETRLDYQELDAPRGHLVVTHMNDNSVLVLSLSDAAVVKELPGIPRPRGVAIGDDRIFVTSTGSVVIIDAITLTEIARVKAGSTPDGIAIDAVDHIVGVSEQHDGAVAFLEKSGSGARTLLPLGKEVGNVVFDPTRKSFFAAVVNEAPPNQLVQLDPAAHRVTARIDLPGCERAHGVRIHPDGQSAFVACEDNDTIVRVTLDATHALTAAKTGKKPDVMSIDPGLGWIYVAAESGDLTVFDIHAPGLREVDREHPGDDSHSVVVDPATHRVFFPLLRGPVMRIMRPAQ